MDEQARGWDWLASTSTTAGALMAFRIGIGRWSALDGGDDPDRRTVRCHVHVAEVQWSRPALGRPRTGAEYPSPGESASASVSSTSNP